MDFKNNTEVINRLNELKDNKEELKTFTLEIFDSVDVNIMSLKSDLASNPELLNVFSDTVRTIKDENNATKTA